jgi:hypothetical protein
MDNIVVVEIVNSFEDLSYCLRAVLFREATFVDDALEKLTAECELCDNVELILQDRVSIAQLLLL